MTFVSAGSAVSEGLIRNMLLDMYSIIKDKSDEDFLYGPAQGLKKPFRCLDELAARDVSEDMVRSLLCDPQLKPVLKAVAGFRDVYSLRLEVKWGRSIAESERPLEILKGFSFYPNYLSLGKTEFEGANLKSGDYIAFLGSGPLPLSLIVLCQVYGVKGVGIERVPQWAALSREVIDRLGLSAEIEILDGDHSYFPLKKNVQLTMVAAAAQPKAEIFAHLKEVLLPGTKVSYRIYEKGLRRLLDCDSSFVPPPDLREYLRVRPQPPVNNTSIFLIKE